MRVYMRVGVVIGTPTAPLGAPAANAFVAVGLDGSVSEQELAGLTRDELNARRQGSASPTRQACLTSRLSSTRSPPRTAAAGPCPATARGRPGAHGCLRQRRAAGRL